MIRRDLGAAGRQQFDLAIIGGGIHGACLAQQAARCGLSVALFEAADFGSGTSWNSLRILHGGLRYLQSFDLRGFRQTVAARHWLARRLPALLRPLPCVLPLYGAGLRRAAVLRPGLLANNLLDRRRRAGLVPELQLPPARMLSVAETIGVCPQIAARRLEGAACWNDYFMVSPERILIELLRDAGRHGAVTCNYTPVEELLASGRRVRGLLVRDRLTGRSIAVAARRVVNCAGPWLPRFAADLGEQAETLFRPSLAFNLLLRRSPPAAAALAVAAAEPGAPVLLLLPFGGNLLAGTLHLPRPAGTTVAEVTTDEFGQLLGLLNAALPGLNLRQADVLRVFAGLLPATAAESAELARRPLVTDHALRGGLAGLYSVTGIKFTTAPAVAGTLLRRLGVAPPPADAAGELPLSSETGLLTDHASLETVAAPELQRQLQRVAAEEAVCCVEDLLLRRSNWGALGGNPEQLAGRLVELTGLPQAIQSAGGAWPSPRQ